MSKLHKKRSTRRQLLSMIQQGKVYHNLLADMCNTLITELQSVDPGNEVALQVVARLEDFVSEKKTKSSLEGTEIAKCI